ncbi:MAG: hypothetical protein H7175_05730 [Burkholderiales bacterium]|nr:hypothetical protein [Anaerolineae bacterium]
MSHSMIEGIGNLNPQGHTSAHSEQEAHPNYGKLLALHKGLYSRIRNHHLNLHATSQKSAIITNQSVTSPRCDEVLALSYFRSSDQARLVESLMGIDDLVASGSVDTYRHPVIELRLTPEHFAVELILTPFAWWDQQNFIGKLAVNHHRKAFRTLLRGLDNHFRFGFWDGVKLNDMHLMTWQLLRGNILDEWMATFADGQDCLRVGMWYTPDDPALDDANIVNEAFDQVKALYELYQFMVWTSDNNFRSFYERQHNRAFA